MLYIYHAVDYGDITVTVIIVVVTVIFKRVAIPISVPITVSVLFTTAIHIDVLSYSLKIQYTILRATTHAIGLIV